jgi:hypothetical protein
MIGAVHHGFSLCPSQLWEDYSSIVWSSETSRAKELESMPSELFLAELKAALTAPSHVGLANPPVRLLAFVVTTFCNVNRKSGSVFVAV